MPEEYPYDPVGGIILDYQKFYPIKSRDCDNILKTNEIDCTGIME
jgi:hypothetical protein